MIGRLLGKLFGGSVEAPDIRLQIFPSRNALFEAVARQTEQLISVGSSGVLLVAHFPDTLHRLKTLRDDLSPEAPVRVLAAELLTPELGRELKFDSSHRFDLLLVDQHPLPAEDDRPLQFAAQIDGKCVPMRMVSLEDPLLRTFVNDGLQKMLQSAFVDDPQESIQSRMVARRLRAVQLQIEKTVERPVAADSQAAWLKNNEVAF